MLQSFQILLFATHACTHTHTNNFCTLILYAYIFIQLKVHCNGPYCTCTDFTCTVTASPFTMNLHWKIIQHCWKFLRLDVFLATSYFCETLKISLLLFLCNQINLVCLIKSYLQRLCSFIGHFTPKGGNVIFRFKCRGSYFESSSS